MQGAHAPLLLRFCVLLLSALMCSYETYDELYDYCYRVAGTVALMSVPVMGVDKAYKVRSTNWAKLEACKTQQEVGT